MKSASVVWCFSLACVAVVCAGFWLHDGVEAANPPSFATPNQITHDGLVKTAVLSDGSWLYVAEEKDGHQVISKIDPKTGKESTIAAPFADVRAIDVAPDQKSLLAVPTRAGQRNGELWTIPLNQVAASRMGDLTAGDAAWAPNGEDLVSVKGHEIWITSTKGMGGKKVAEVKGRPFRPRFSPDGQTVRFSVSDIETNTSVLWEVGWDGSNLHEMLAGWSKGQAVCCGVWSKDGKSYIFQTTPRWPVMTTMLWALPESGQGEPKQLTDGPMSFGSPWPAESDKIWALGVRPLGEVVKYDPVHETVSKVLSGVSATDVDFSPDGKWATYVSIPDSALWRSRADGSERKQLTFAPEKVVLPQWSPDSKQIAYVSTKVGEPSRIMLIGVDGGKPVPVYVEKYGQIDVNWSADGKRMMYGTIYGTPEMSINILDLKAQTITKIPGSDKVYSPRWSPDGRYVAALSLDMKSVMLFEFQTQKWTTWAKEAAGSVSYPTWSKDSKYLYFDDMVTDEETIRRVKVGEDHPERVFGVRGIEHYMGPWGNWSGQMLDGSYMFVQDRSTQEVYSLNLGVSK
jgi:Tol biopolymer transport system component